jgi:hypothetical protein
MFFLITTCLKEENNQLREEQYREGIKSLLHHVPDKSKIIIIENNTNGNTFLDSFGTSVFYTKSNELNNVSIGYKELFDIQKCIQEFSIDDEEFVVKFTGRYRIEEDSSFFKELKTLSKEVGAVIRYGPYYYPAAMIQYEDCVTGLIGMKAKYIKQIPLPTSFEPVEHLWAKTSLAIQETVKIIPSLDLTIFPGGSDEFVYKL